MLARLLFFSPFFFRFFSTIHRLPRSIMHTILVTCHDRTSRYAIQMDRCNSQVTEQTLIDSWINTLESVRVEFFGHNRLVIAGFFCFEQFPTLCTLIRRRSYENMQSKEIVSVGSSPNTETGKRVSNNMLPCCINKQKIHRNVIS